MRACPRTRKPTFAVGVCEERSELGHLVDFVDSFAGEEVESVEVVGVALDDYLLVGLRNGDSGLEYDALTFLYPLSHGVEVCGEVASGGEDAFAVLSFALAVELFPPFGEVVEFGAEVDEDFFVVRQRH